MISRDIYLNDLISFKDKNLIKITTGIRRCGKSTLFKLYQDYLLENGVDKKQIISINFEDLAYEELLEYKKLYDYITEKLQGGKQNYIFLDEIQNVKNFEKAVDSLHLKENVDIYLTGSNAYLLSSELATLLTGRYVEIKMLPLSFKEYLQNDKTDMGRKFTNYLANSSFPYVTRLGSKKEIKMYLDGLYSTIILKDIIQRRNIRDINIFQSVIRYMFDNISNLTSTKKISDTLTSMGRKTSVNTVEGYLQDLCNSYIMHKVSRYDIKGKNHLKTGDKYYICDIGLRYFLLGSEKQDLGRMIENVVYLELLRRGYEIYVGKVGDMEVDFVAIKDDITYFQVALTTRDENTLRRELKSLQNIKDHHPKYLITMDEEPTSSYDGVKKVNLLEWLVGE